MTDSEHRPEPSLEEESPLARFEAQRQMAQRRRVRRLLGALGVGACVLLLAASMLLLTRGVRLLIEPADAADTAAVTLLEGTGLPLGDRIYTISPLLKARVSAPGFFPADVSIDAQRTSNFVKVTLRERPAQLQVSTDPPAVATRWRVDGEVVATAPILDYELPPGQYRLMADNPYYERVTQDLSLERAEQYESVVSLEPIEGDLLIDSEPGGAQVFIDDEPLGTTPVSLRVPGGEYTVRVALADHAEVVETVAVTRGRPSLRRNYRLQSNPASLRVNVSPGGGKLMIDGTVRRASSGPFQLSSGVAHTVLYAFDGFGSKSTAVTLAPGERRELTLALAPQIGQVRVESTPPAQVLVDGRVQGTTPIDLSLSAVEHRIRISKAGYESVERTLRPSPDGEQLISVNLLTVEQAKLRQAKRRYRNAAGLEMIRFEPTGTFTAGAPRDERGQRSNEHVREVRLTRPFYASRSEVTREQYARYQPSPGGGAGNLPVSNVSWSDAARFCNWLSAQEGLTPVYRFAGQAYVGANTSADGYRLLTEAEWEWLARAAGRRQQTRFPWGNSYTVPEKAGNFSDETAANDSAVRGQLDFFLQQYTDGFAQLAPVGSFDPNRAGLVDLAGNVSEWVHDLYSPSPPSGPSPALDPTGPGVGEGHVIKGSSWRSGRVEYLRAAYRNTGSGPLDDVGFRVARYIY